MLTSRETRLVPFVVFAGLHLVLTITIATVVLVLLAASPRFSGGCSCDDVYELKKRVAVQGVELQDAEKRIHALEADMDHVAPHTPLFRP
jgi:hypothetical protein